VRRIALIGALLLALVGATTTVSLSAPADAGQAPSAAHRHGGFGVERRITMNNPTHHPGTIARQLKSYIQHTPSGATISIMTFYMSSTITWPALSAAYKRGVHIRAVLYGGASGQPLAGVSSEGVRLAAMINAGRAHGREGSSVVWTHGTARGKDGQNAAMHAKMWQFSRVGRTPKVTMIGSYNNGDDPDHRAFAAMVTLTDAKLYRDAQSVFKVAQKDRYVGHNPQVRFSGPDWDAYFFPSTPITRGNDPVLQRLMAIPGNANTTITISMYSFQGFRGHWLARRLASMTKHGAHVTLVAGPDVSRPVLNILRKAGANLQDGCWSTGNGKFAYTHDKEMAATWMKDGKRQQGAWFGSDDWGDGPGGSHSDQAAVSLYSPWAYNRLSKLLAVQVAHRPDNLSPCHPLD
jgi:hypothetical protein